VLLAAALVLFAVLTGIQVPQGERAAAV